MPCRFPRGLPLRHCVPLLRIRPAARIRADDRLGPFSLETVSAWAYTRPELVGRHIVTVPNGLPFLDRGRRPRLIIICMGPIQADYSLVSRTIRQPGTLKCPKASSSRSAMAHDNREQIMKLLRDRMFLILRWPWPLHTVRPGNPLRKPAKIDIYALREGCGCGCVMPAGCP